MLVFQNNQNNIYINIVLILLKEKLGHDLYNYSIAILILFTVF